MLPVITPPFVIGLALILLFGRAGIVNTLLEPSFDMPRTRWIYGMPGLTIAQLLAFTPISSLVLLGVLQGVSPSLEEAAQTLRAGRWRTFARVTWPLIRPGLANAFLIAFVESLADFGNPIMIGGNFRVLSTADLLRRRRRRAGPGPGRRARHRAAGAYPRRLPAAARLDSAGAAT